MMPITTDERLIRSILEDKSVIDGFNGGKRIEDLSNAVYFYDKAVGLFPCRIKGKVISIHAAIPKENRGIKAVKSAKSLVSSLVSAGYDVIARVMYTDKHVQRFVNMVGFIYLCDKDGFKIYRYV